MIYDYLFYKSYQLGKRSGNFQDIPVLAGVIWVGICFMFNIFAIDFFLEGVVCSRVFSFDSKYKFIFSLCLVLILIFYYSYKDKYKKIIRKYEKKESINGKSIHPVLIIIFYYVTSFLILLVSSMYKNGDGIFK